MELDAQGNSFAMRPTYSIVIPAFSEEAVIEESLNHVHDFLVTSELMNDTEVIVVAAESSDRTAHIAKELSPKFTFFQLLEPGKKVGKGRDVREGILAARGDFVVFTDADLATPIHHVFHVFEALKQNDDVVIGVRDLSKIHTGYRSLLSRGSNILTRVVILPGISDTQCGFKGFRKETAQKIFSRSIINGWSFDIEVLKLARKLGHKIREVKIDDWDDPKLDAGMVGENPVIAISRSLFELFEIRFRFWLRAYKF
jgi:dolichyl-phosphate beta-glucosyltransferase